MPWRRMGKCRYISTILGLSTRRKWSASRPGRFIPGETAPGTHWIGCWVAQKLVWTLWSTEKSLAPTGNRTLPVESVARYTDWALQDTRRDRGKPRKPWVVIVCVPEEIRIEHILNTILECYRYGKPLSFNVRIFHKVSQAHSRNRIAVGDLIVQRASEKPEQQWGLIWQCESIDRRGRPTHIGSLVALSSRAREGIDVVPSHTQPCDS
jgi:hypothetical protein